MLSPGLALYAFTGADYVAHVGTSAKNDSQGDRRPVTDLRSTVSTTVILPKHGKIFYFS